MSHRTAKVKIENKTGKILRSIHVLHKYSNDYKNKHDWGVTMSGAESNTELEVDYTTGFLTTGRNWWIVTWEYEGDNKVYFSNPNNFRGFIDTIEKAGSIAIKAALTAAAAAKTAGVGTKAGAAAGAIITGLLFNSESTSGFKQHILRKSDAGKRTTISINNNNRVEWKSPSGNSVTESSYISA